MEERIRIRPLGVLERFADACMVPLMYAVSGTLGEWPQRTHRWNNTRLTPTEVGHLRADRMVSCEGIPSAHPRWRLGLPFFHLPIFGGWKEYVVIAPAGPSAPWHVGWLTSSAAGVSHIPLGGPVRMLLGPELVSFFGIDAAGVEIPLRELGRGAVGDGGPYAHIPLL